MDLAKHAATGAASKVVFPYKPLDENAIRVISFENHSPTIDIRLSIKHVRRLNSSERYGERTVAEGLDDLPVVDYTALSYCWGDATITRKVSLNGIPVSITLNLWNALSSVISQHNQSTYYWVDALCINQEDPVEKSVQVQQMWKIFSGADQVFAWLGLESDDTDPAFAAMKKAAELCREPSGDLCQLSSGAKTFMDCVTKCDQINVVCEHVFEAKAPLYCLDQWQAEILRLARSEYFERTWIIPEMLQARSLRLLCGSLAIDWTLFQHALNHIDDHAFAEWLLYDRTRYSDFQALDTEIRPVNLTMIMQEVWESKCADTRDKIFSMAGHPGVRLLDVRGRLQTDYSLTVDELFLLTLAWLDDIDSDWPDRKTFEASQKRLCAANCLGLPQDLCEHETYTFWILDHSDWDLTHLPSFVITESRRKLACPGFISTPFA